MNSILLLLLLLQDVRELERRMCGCTRTPSLHILWWNFYFTYYNIKFQDSEAQLHQKKNNFTKIL